MLCEGSQWGAVSQGFLTLSIVIVMITTPGKPERLLLGSHGGCLCPHEGYPVQFSSRVHWLSYRLTPIVAENGGECSIFILIKIPSTGTVNLNVLLDLISLPFRKK